MPNSFFVSFVTGHVDFSVVQFPADDNGVASGLVGVTFPEGVVRRERFDVLLQLNVVEQTRVMKECHHN